MFLIHSVINRSDRLETVREATPISDNRTTISATVETALSAFAHHGRNEENDYWWAWSDDQPNVMHRWVVRETAPETSG